MTDAAGVSSSAIVTMTIRGETASTGPASFVLSGGTTGYLPGGFYPGGWTNPDGVHGGGVDPTQIRIFDKDALGGLSIIGADANTVMTFTYSEPKPALRIWR